MLLNKKILLALAVIALGGCSSSKQLYSWDQYQPTIYQYYLQDQSGPQEQIATLEKVVEKSKAKAKSIPPGLYAHLGLLYANVGQPDRAYQYFEAEKALFPESAPFMDFLLKQKGAKK